MVEVVTGRRLSVGPHAGFWIVAVTFLLVMAYSTLPTPLYPIYQERDGFPPFVLTLIFASYAVGVVVSLFFAGHISDWVGRRRVLIVAVLVSAASAVLFVFFTDVPELIVARFVNGVSIGMLTATATAHLGELRAAARPDENAIVAASVSGAANLGGLSLGPLFGGLFAEYLPNPLMLPHVVFLVILVVAVVALMLVPETVEPPESRVRYRPQRVSVPPGAGVPFGIAAFGAFSSFAVLGLFTSLAPTFLVVTFDVRDHLMAGATSFAAFGSAAAAQVLLARLRLRRQLGLAVAACAIGLALIAVGAITPQLGVFLVGGIIAGVGVGLLFKASLGTVVMLADPRRKGETLALVFLCGYAGLAIPVLGVGWALGFAPPMPVLLVFAALALVATVISGLALRRRATRRTPSPAPA